eukprot:351627-Chlamydomonas_euryale.AAC.3
MQQCSSAHISAVMLINQAAFRVFWLFLDGGCGGCGARLGAGPAAASSCGRCPGSGSSWTDGSSDDGGSGGH